MAAAAGDDECIEVVGPSAIHPLTRGDALKRERDADLLGRGQFGKCYRGRRYRGRRDERGSGEVAIKVMKKPSSRSAVERLAMLRACERSLKELVAHLEPPTSHVTRHGKAHISLPAVVEASARALAFLRLHARARLCARMRLHARARLRGGTSPRADDATRLSAKREANPRLNPLTVVHHTIIGADLE